MYEEKPQNKFIAFILTFLSEYLVWIIIIGVLLAWYFFPELIENLGQVILFWAPVIILICGLIIALTRNKIKAKKDEEKGIAQYDITITKIDLYWADLLIYLGSMLILFLPFLIKENGVGMVDLFQALIYFLGAHWLKRIYYNKIPK